MRDDPKDVYRRATELDPATAELLRARAQAALDDRGRRSLVAPLVIALAATAVAVIVLWERHDRPAALPLANVSLSSEAAVSGTRAAPVVHWEEGQLNVDVVPHQGVDLTVSTPEATIRVVGTVFAVERTHRATRVTVDEGTVRVTCVGGTELAVVAGEDRTCLPADPASLLIRLAELNRAGASAVERLETATAGLASVDPSSPLRPELLAHRTRALADAGDVDEAIASAEVYLAEPDGPRRAELLSFVARTRYEREGCGAIPVLKRAVREVLWALEALLLATCIVDSDPAGARALLERSDGWASGEWRRVADDLRARLDR